MRLDLFEEGNKTNESEVNFNDLEIDMSNDIYILTYKRASRPTGWDGIVALLDGYEAS